MILLDGANLAWGYGMMLGRRYVLLLLHEQVL